MLELPESSVISDQLNATILGKVIKHVEVLKSPHKFAWFNGDPAEYPEKLIGKTFGHARNLAGLIEIEFEDGCALNASMQMYSGLWCFEAGIFENPYYLTAQSMPTPLTEAFDKAYFTQLIQDPKHQKLTMKALIATEQRIPGLHPKRKLITLSEQEKESLFDSIKNTLAEASTTVMGVKS